ncbi:hypothetical protein AB6A40_002922 [Gnathostoma spinigerum]|uniref:RRM domain-containing protein n=1 Tax=Gnathostoma spinigerum TaxID=75299 RepID=A0ABD6EGY4_9BILA
MFSPIFSTGGVYVPQQILMPLGSPANANRLPYFPSVGHPTFPFGLRFPSNSFPRMGVNGCSNATASGEGPPQLRKLFIGGLSHETTDEQLWKYYSQWGKVVDCIVIRDQQTKYSRGFGFVTFATVQMAEAAMADRPHTINCKVVDPKRAIPREQMSPLLPSQPPPFLDVEPEPGCKVSISGIQWDYHTVDNLRFYFDTFGVVEQVEILGHPRGHGFVVFENKADAEKCLAYGKVHIINGQKCEVASDFMQTPNHVNGDVSAYEADNCIIEPSVAKKAVVSSEPQKLPASGACVDSVTEKIAAVTVKSEGKVVSANSRAVSGDTPKKEGKSINTQNTALRNTEISHSTAKETNSKQDKKRSSKKSKN